MKNHIKWALIALPVMACILAGCSDEIGKSPAGSADQAKKEFEAQDPQKQIAQIQYSPIPPAAKEEKIKAIEAKYGIKRQGAATSGGPAGATPAPASASPAGN